MKELTNEERREYAKRAVETRHKRALLKAELHKGSLTASDVLDNLDKYPYMKGIRIHASSRWNWYGYSREAHVRAEDS